VTRASFLPPVARSVTMRPSEVFPAVSVLPPRRFAMSSPARERWGHGREERERRKA